MAPDVGPSRGQAGNVTVLRLDSVSKRFGGVDAVADLSFAVAPGHVTGLIGPNGAGKTTVINLVTGILAPTRGRILVGDRDIGTLAPYQIARTGIARTFQNVRLLREASVLDNLVVGFHRHERTSLFANLVGLPAVWRERGEFRRRALDLLARFGMSDYAAAQAGALSYGHQRRVEIMRALATEPRFLLLDEPVAGMNDVEAASLGAVFRDLAAAGMAVLLIEHNMRLVMEVCDIVHVVDSGRLIASGPPDSVSADEAVLKAYLGT
jgi:branched-chain amino acid transport system ATP-binding protein